MADLSHLGCAQFLSRFFQARKSYIHRSVAVLSVGSWIEWQAAAHGPLGTSAALGTFSHLCMFLISGIVYPKA